ncbi:hypothetical protein [Chromobacterium rhizoryzae]|uniref:hypothetical protein n=1 Tax=Chromobacterium rhizoryzae TaxID=1778675 RepID=UPI001D06E90B|nr:hypothetical protein [Chromobacterium rhizoryzae]
MSKTFPTRRRYRQASLEAREALLPFVSRRPGRPQADYWQMPAAHPDYAADCAYGRECGAHFVQWLKDNPGYCGQSLLARITRDIDFRKPEQRGYRVGFFNYLEAMLTLAARKVDVFEHVDELHRQQQAQIKRKNMENRAVRKIEKK